MGRTRIKFCGITRPEDALAAAAAGADAIGLIFYSKSPRCVSVHQATEILRTLPPMVTPVALFVNSPAEEVRDTALSLTIRTVQLHGDESPGILAQLPGLSAIKAIKSDAATLPIEIKTWVSVGIAGILLETAGTHEPGGTGIENNWAAIESINHLPELPPLIAAGGLTAENVDRVVRRLHPWAVDVSTGIEVSRGIKSADKMKRFVAAVCAADMS